MKHLVHTLVALAVTVLACPTAHAQKDRMGNFEIQRLMSSFNQMETLSSNVRRAIETATPADVAGTPKLAEAWASQTASLEKLRVDLDMMANVIAKVIRDSVVSADEAKELRAAMRTLQSSIQLENQKIVAADATTPVGRTLEIRGARIAAGITAMDDWESPVARTK